MSVVRELVGKVVSNRMKKTVVVSVERLTRDARFKRTVRERKKFKAHDEKNECGIGDQVLLVECRPLSREKCWMVRKIIRKGFGVDPVEASE